MVTEQAFSFDDLIVHFKSSEAALRALCDGKIAAITGEHGTLVVHSPATATYGDHGEHMTVGVTKVSLDYRLESANAAYCHMLGYSERELVGRHLEEITQPESIAENIRLLSQLSRGP